MIRLKSILRKTSLCGRDNGRRRAMRPLVAAVETLELRILFDVQVSSSANDTAQHNQQREASVVAFMSPGSNATQIAAAYNDEALNNSTGGMIGMGTAYTWTGSDAFNSSVLPQVSGGVSGSTGVGRDPSLAWDAENSTLYSAGTSAPFKNEIQAYASTTGGETFNGVSATPGNMSGTPDFDKPWLAVDNFAGNGFGTLWLASIYRNGTAVADEIDLTHLSPGGTWPSGTGTRPPGSVVPISFFNKTYAEPEGPVVLVGPDHSVYVIYLAVSSGVYSICMQHSIDGISWSGAPIELAQIEYGNPNFDFQVSGSDGTATLITAAHPFPSAAINPVSGDIYVTYADMPVGGPSSTVHFLRWSSQAGVTDLRPISVQGLTDNWQPTIAVSPTGTELFAGFYGGNRVYVGGGTGIEQINRYYVTASIDANGSVVNWALPKQSTNLDQSGNPTGNCYKQPADTDMGDFDTSTADLYNFYDAYLVTSNETFSDGSTALNQPDIHMATIPIPYLNPTGVTIPTPGGISVQPNDSGALTVYWNGQPYNSMSPMPQMYLDYSTTTQGWLPLGGGSLTDASVGFAPVPAIPNYDPTKTYYFRLRAGYSKAATTYDGISGLSGVVQSWTYSSPTSVSAVGYLYYQSVYHPPQYGNDHSYDYPTYEYRTELTLTWPGQNTPPGRTDATLQMSVNNQWVNEATTGLTSAGGDIYFTLDYNPLDWNTNFRIRLANDYGGGSATTGFKIAQISLSDVPTKPIISSAYATNGNVDLVVNWNGSAYQNTSIGNLELQISGDDSTWYDPSSPDGRLWVNFGGDPYAPSGHVEISGLDPSTTYYVRLRAVGPIIDGVQTYSEWTDAFQVQPQA